MTARRGAARARSRRAPAAATLACLAAAAGLLAPPARAAERPLRLSVTETLLAEWRADNRNGADDDDDYGVLVNRLNLGGTAGGLTASVRTDASLFLSPPTGAYRDELRLERFNVRYALGDWTLEAGDLHRQLGRGIVLSLRKVDELGRDIALRGGEVAWASRALDLSLFAGLTNPSNLDSVSQKHLPDPSDTLVGFTASGRPSGAVRLDLFGLYLRPREQLLDDEEDRNLSLGAAAEWRVPGDALTLYVEGAVQDRRLAAQAERGYAGYLAADLLLGDVTVLVEGLFLDAFEQKGSRNQALGSRFDYNQPPTLERVDQEVLDTRDVAGGRVRVEGALLDGDLLLYVNGMLRLTSPLEDSRVQQIHAYAGGEYAYDLAASRVAVSGGYRTESQQGRTVKTMGHAELDWIHALSERLSLHVVSQNELRTLEERAYKRGSLFVGADLARVGGLTFELGYDDQDPSEDVRKLFYAAIVAVHVTERVQLRATGGTQRGGIKCIAGVCRDLPEFAGARVEAIGRF